VYACLPPLLPPDLCSHCRITVRNVENEADFVRPPCAFVDRPSDSRRPPHPALALSVSDSRTVSIDSTTSPIRGDVIGGVDLGAPGSGMQQRSIAASHSPGSCYQRRSSGARAQRPQGSFSIRACSPRGVRFRCFRPTGSPLESGPVMPYTDFLLPPFVMYRAGTPRPCFKRGFTPATSSPRHYVARHLRNGQTPNAFQSINRRLNIYIIWSRW